MIYKKELEEFIKDVLNGEYPDDAGELDGVIYVEGLNECEECGCLFFDDEKIMVTEEVEEMYGATLDGGYYVRYYDVEVEGCPNCGSSSFREYAHIEIYEDGTWELH